MAGYRRIKKMVGVNLLRAFRWSNQRQADKGSEGLTPAYVKAIGTKDDERVFQVLLP